MSTATAAKLVWSATAWPASAHVEELLKLAPDLYDITVFGAEPHPTTTASCSRRCWRAR
jgi:NAD(P)H-nitrite reductase large subunit